MQLSNLAFIAAIIGVFYFMVIRPQQKRTREQQQMISALSPGDEILTIGGIFATVISVGERVRVAIADGSELEIAAPAIAKRIPSVSGDDAVASGGDDDAEGSTRID